MLVVRKAVRLGTKLGILGGACYYTTKVGLWGDSLQTEQLYKELYNVAAPYMKKTPIEVPELPRMSDATRELTHSWNRGVIASTNFLVHLPTHVASWATTIYEKVNDLISDPSPPST